MLPQNTMVVTMVCILVAVQIGHTLTTFVTHFSFSVTCLAHEVADYVKCASYCLIILLLQTTLYGLTISHSEIDFYGMKVTFSSQWNVLQGNIFYTKIMLWLSRNFILLNPSLLWCSLEKNHTHVRAHTHTRACVCINILSYM
jgi:hypothetical protein